MHSHPSLAFAARDSIKYTGFLLDMCGFVGRIEARARTPGVSAIQSAEAFMVSSAQGNGG